MKNILLLLVILHLTARLLASPQVNRFVSTVTDLADNAQEIANKWIQFKSKNMKQFTLEEDQRRFNIFKDNLKRIEDLTQKFQRGLINFKVSINQFADLTKNEFVNTYLKIKAPNGRFRRDLQRVNRTKRQIPSSVNWRNTGAVTPVKDQGRCSCCWAFSAVGALEGQYYLRTGSLTSFSEQNLMDCSIDQVNDGCNGGWMANAYQYMKNYPITTLNLYPYAAQRQQCRQSSGSNQIRIQGYKTIAPNEMALKQAVGTVGPISAALDATNLQFYAGGVYRDDECTQGKVNHGILIVGYGNEGGRDYWLIKNSWGSKWGENGYFKMIRNRDNQCNIATYGMYPVL